MKRESIDLNKTSFLEVKETRMGKVQIVMLPVQKLSQKTLKKLRSVKNCIE